MEVNKQDSSSEKILKRILNVESFINSYKEKNKTITKNIPLKTIFNNLTHNRQIIQYEAEEFQSQAEITDTFKKIFKIQWDLIPKTNPLKTQEVIVTIDTIDWPYYGKTDNPYLRGTKPEHGARYCYKFIYMDITHQGKKYSLITLPISKMNTISELLEEIIKFAQEKVKIKLALLDKGLFNDKTLKILNTHDIKYIIPCIQSLQIKKLIKLIPAPCVIKDWKIKNDIRFNLVMGQVSNIYGTKKTYVLATNIPVKGNKPKEIRWIAEEYKKRWSIEFGNRIKKTYLPRTTASNYKKRLFCFLYAILMYNLLNFFRK